VPPTPPASRTGSTSIPAIQEIHRVGWRFSNDSVAVLFVSCSRRIPEAHVKAGVSSPAQTWRQDELRPSPTRGQEQRRYSASLQAPFLSRVSASTSGSVSPWVNAWLPHMGECGRLAYAAHAPPAGCLPPTYRRKRGNSPLPSCRRRRSRRAGGCHDAAARGTQRSVRRRSTPSGSVAVTRCCHASYTNKNGARRRRFDSRRWSQGLDSNQRYTVLQVVGERTEPSATVRIRIENWTRVPHPSAPVRGHPDRLLSPLLSVRSRLVSRDSRRCREAIVDRLVDGHRACADDDQSENAKHDDANHDATADLKDELHARPPADYRPILHGSVAIRGCLRAVWASPSPRRRQDRHIVTDLDSRPLKPRLRR
jgi:hypothetical protein